MKHFTVQKNQALHTFFL